MPVVATIAGVTNAFARIMWGSISDRFGREYTMAFAFALEGDHEYARRLVRDVLAMVR